MKKISILLGLAVIGFGVNAMAAPLPQFCSSVKTLITMGDDSGMQGFAFLGVNDQVLYVGNTNQAGSSQSFTCGQIAGLSAIGFGGYSLPAANISAIHAYDNIDISLENQDSNGKTPLEMCTNNIQEAINAGGGGNSYDVGNNTLGETVCVTVTGYNNT